MGPDPVGAEEIPWSEFDLRVMSDPRLWAGQNCRVTRRAPGGPESGFIRSEGGVPILQIVAGFVLYGYSSWEDVLEAGWRPV